MRRYMVGVCLCVAVLLPTIGSAQVFIYPTAPPQTTGADAPWVRAGDPLFYAGNFYYPSGPSIFFDGNVMRRTGVFQGVPLYEDSTLEPYSIVYVPIGNNVMRPYERRREGELAGTVGSRMPSFPIQRDAEAVAAAAGTGVGPLPTPTIAGIAAPVTAPGVAGPGAAAPAVTPPAAAPAPEGAVGTVGIIGPGAPAPITRRSVTPSNTRRSAAPSVRRPRATDGVWIEFDGRRWYSDGPSVQYDANRFAPIGTYRGFPVYREASAGANRIFVTVVPNGPLAPFTRR